MLAALGFGFWDDWEISDKVLFDGQNKLMVVAPGVTALDIRTDVWSRYLDWHSLRDNSRHGIGMRFIGLDPTPQGPAGDIYFLQQGWRLVINLNETAVTGTLFSDDFDTAYYNSDLGPLYPATASNLVSNAAEPPTTAAIATAVWGYTQ